MSRKRTKVKIQIHNKGSLTSLGYRLSASPSLRHQALRKAVHKYGYKSTMAKVNTLYIWNKNKRKNISSKASSDKKWLNKTFKTSKGASFGLGSKKKSSRKARKRKSKKKSSRKARKHKSKKTSSRKARKRKSKKKSRKKSKVSKKKIYIGLRGDSWKMKESQINSLIKKYGDFKFRKEIVPKIRNRVRSWYGKKGKRNWVVKLGTKKYNLKTGRFER